jgi:hypothetical protein
MAADYGNRELIRFEKVAFEMIATHHAALSSSRARTIAMRKRSVLRTSSTSARQGARRSRWSIMAAT